MADNDPQPGIVATVVGATDVGRVREHNEDAFLVMESGSGRRLANGEVIEVDLATPVVMAVADGMGGAAAGEVASQMTSDRLAENLGGANYAEVTPDQIVALMDGAVQQANEEILSEAKSNSDRKGMGSTVTAAIALGTKVYVSQVGDSRAYLLRKKKLVQLTKDQSLIGQLIEEGTLTEEEAEKLGGRNIVLQAVGVEENLRVDTKHWEMLRGDTLLLCSDGLSGMITDADIERIMNEAAGDLGLAAKQLIDASNEGGGRDNITAVIIRFDGEGLRAPMEALDSKGIERAGAEFKAPPPPEVPNPMRKVAVVGVVALAIIAALFLVLRRTTAKLDVGWAPADVPVTLVLREGGEEVRRVDEATGGLHALDKVALGSYELEASAEHYFSRTVKFDITVAADTSQTLSLVPRPGTLHVKSATPGVDVVVVPKGPGAKEDQKYVFHLPDTTTPQTSEGFPAGLLVVTATRVGFEPYEQEHTLAPEGTLEITIPARDEVKGEVVVKSDIGGFRVWIVDGAGEELASGTTPAGGGEVRLEAREGGHVLKWSQSGYASDETTVEVARGNPVSHSITARSETVLVTFAGGPAGKSGTLYTRSAGGGRGDWLYPVNFGDDGRTQRGSPLKPGDYVLVVKGHPDTSFSVPAGSKPFTVNVQ